jgi:hypothetical protein
MRKVESDVVLVAAALGWAVLFVVWLLCGSGYQFVQPGTYELTTRILLSSPLTASEASDVIQAHGYLSMIEQHRLLSRIAH